MVKVLGNGQAESHSVHAARRRIVFALERFEQAVYKLFADSLSRISDREIVNHEIVRHFFFFGKDYVHSALVRISDGIAHEMHKNLFELIRVHTDFIVFDFVALQSHF